MARHLFSGIRGLALVLVGSAFALGCTKIQSVRVAPNSHFVPPDATVRELGPVNAEMGTGVSLLFFPDPDLETSRLDARLFDLALKQQVGANVILNYVLVARIRTIVFLASWGSMEVEGTAAEVIPAGSRGAAGSGGAQ